MDKKDAERPASYSLHMKSVLGDNTCINWILQLENKKEMADSPIYVEGYALPTTSVWPEQSVALMDVGTGGGVLMSVSWV